MNYLKEYSQLLLSNPLAATFGAGIMGVVTYMYGTGITLTATGLFVLLIVLDWLSGRAASKRDGSYASEYGINGAYRTAVIMILLFIAYRIDVELNLPYVAFGYLIVNFGLPMWRSMAANVYRAGWERWIPQIVLSRITDEIEHKTARANKRVLERTQYLDKE